MKNSGLKRLWVWFNKDFDRSSCRSHKSLKIMRQMAADASYPPPLLFTPPPSRKMKRCDSFRMWNETKWWIKKATRLWACVAKQTKGRRDLFVSHQVETNWKGQRGGVFRDCEAFRVIPGVWQKPALTLDLKRRKENIEERKLIDVKKWKNITEAAIFFTKKKTSVSHNKDIYLRIKHDVSH